MRGLSGIVLQAVGGWGTVDRSRAERNIRLFYWDGLWLGVVFGVAGNFLVVFNTRLGASPWLLGAMTSGPALLSILWQLQAAHLVERHSDHIRLTRQAAGLLYAGYLLVALVPFVFPQALRPYAIVGIALLQALPTAVWGVVYASLLPELAGRRRMPVVVGTQNALLGLTSTLTVMLCGVILSSLPFPRGYQAIFLMSFLASLGSLWVLGRLRPLDDTPPAQHVASGRPRGSIGATLRDGNFLRFVACAVVLNLGIYAGAPLFPLRWVDQLHLSDAWVSTFATAIGAASILGSWGSRVLAQRWEGRKVVGFTGMLLAIYPVATAQFDRPELIAVAAAGAGLFSGIVNVALFYVLTDVVPAEQRPRYIGVYTWLVNMAIFAGPLVGAAGVQRFGVESALLAAGAIRVLGGLLFLLLPFAAAELARRPAALEAGE